MYFSTKMAKVSALAAFILTTNHSLSTEEMTHLSNIDNPATTEESSNTQASYFEAFVSTVSGGLSTISNGLSMVGSSTTQALNTLQKIEDYQNDFYQLDPDPRTNSALRSSVIKNAAIGFSTGLIIPSVLYAMDSSGTVCVIGGILSTSTTTIGGAIYGYGSHMTNAFYKNKKNFGEIVTAVKEYFPVNG